MFSHLQIIFRCCSFFLTLQIVLRHHAATVYRHAHQHNHPYYRCDFISIILFFKWCSMQALLRTAFVRYPWPFGWMELCYGTGLIRCVYSSKRFLLKYIYYILLSVYFYSSCQFESNCEDISSKFNLYEVLALSSFYHFIISSFLHLIFSSFVMDWLW